MGHPGSGKTTFAAKFLYEGARTYGERGLYIGFGEPERKFKQYMKNLGMDFDKLEQEGLIRIVTLPALASTDTAEMLAETVVKLINEFKPKRVVIDNIPAAIDVLGDVRARAFIQTTLYNVLSYEDTTAIAVTDVYRGEKKPVTPSIEVVADGVILMKAEIRGGLIVRKLIIEKLKGKKIPVAEVPFTLVKGEGIVMFTPPLTYEIPPPKLREPIEVGCEPLKNVLGPLYAGSQVAVITPVGMAIPPEVTVPLLRTVVKAKLKVLLVSLTNPSASIWCRINSQVRKYGINEDELRKLLKITSLNPTAYSVTELMSVILDQVGEYGPEIFVLHGLETLSMLLPPREFTSFYLNIITRLRKASVTTIYVTSTEVSDEISPIINASDIVISISKPSVSGGAFSVRVNVLKSYSGEPKALVSDYLKECLEG